MPHPIYARFACLCVALATLIAAPRSQALDPNLPPSGNFDLTAWKITLPDQTEKSETTIQGFESPDEFYTDPVTGGMVFKCPNDGQTGGSTYPRSELREMLRAGNTSISTQGVNSNNWVFSSSSQASQDAAGGVDGTLTATLTVDHVSTTGSSSKIGRVIVGQIHASTNEPCRLYYRKLPGNTKGTIYVAHEPNIGDEQWYEMIGSRSNSAPDPADGIALGEEWSYVIDAAGDTLTVTIIRAGKPDVVEIIDMSASAFADDWMYFKAGCYNQNNEGDSSQYAQVTFFALTHSHIVGGNQPPSCSITSPAGGATFNEFDDVPITVNASDNDGTVTKVEFYEDGNLLGEDTTAPYSFTWTNVTDGSHFLTAKATDNNGAETTSTAVSITVIPGPNDPPTCNITSPTQGATFSALNDVVIEAVASDIDGTVAKVEFFEGTNLLGEDTTAPYSFTWSFVPAGSYTLTARATDDNAAATTSTVVGITVNPSVVLSSADFESGFGDWVDVGGDSHDWTRDSEGTPSNNTGPSAGATGSTWYVYLETSSNGGGANDAGDTAILEGPNLSGSGRTLSFYYHLYGSEMGTLNVDVFHGGGWTNGVWSLSGQQQTDDTDAYTRTSVDLSAYSGSIRIRFRGVAAGGYRGDMALDGILVTGSVEPNQPPAFITDPITETNATEDVAYSSTIADDASDPESDPMTFSKVSGPAWLSVAGNGALTGMPGAGDVGTNVFTVQVDATGGSDTATMNITVSAASTGGSVTNVIVDDSFADGDRANTGALQADWWSSNSTGGNSIEAYPGQLGLVSGTSGRGIHGTFTPQTLAIGDMLVSTLTFTTPATIGTPDTTAFKIAMMDFNDVGLAADLSSSSGGVNPLYTNLPGYLAGMDIATGTEDIDFQKHDAPNASGRFLGTTSEWTSMGDGPNDGYTFLPNTQYVCSYVLTRTGADSMQLTFTLSDSGGVLSSHSETDGSGIANNFGMLGIWVNGNKFGSTTTQGQTEDNGITFSNIKIELVTASTNAAPTFTVDPITETSATENVAYSGTIADDASDPESDPMTFSKVSGPAWLSVADNGALSGTPGAGDVGTNVFIVQVDATGGSDTATLNITVDPAPIGQPTLEITVSVVGDNVVLSWPTNGTAGFHLQSTTSMSAPDWTPADTPSVVGEKYHVTNSVTGDEKHYRLKYP